MRWLLLIVLCLAAPAEAAVRIDFYSRDTDTRFPHAYVSLTGTLDTTGEAVEADYGFTPYSISPLALIGPIRGHVVSAGREYVSQGGVRFSMVLTDDEYARVMAVVSEWQSRAQPSYDLETGNCVTFVADIAQALGLRIPDDPRLGRRPTTFLNRVATMNAHLLEARLERALTEGAGTPTLGEAQR